MKVLGLTIKCSPELMRKILRHITNQNLDVLGPDQDWLLFRQGAVLHYRGGNLYGIQTYHPERDFRERGDYKSAILQLTAAYLMYQAECKLREVDEVMCTAKEFRADYRGMGKRYPAEHDHRLTYT